LRRLHAIQLVEKLMERHVRLHPLVREFAAGLTPAAETADFRHGCATAVVRASDDLAVMEGLVRSEGVEGLEQCLDTAMEFAAGGADGACDRLAFLLRLYRRESDHLRDLEAEWQPLALAQRLQFRSRTLGDPGMTDLAEKRMITLGSTFLILRWRTLRESPALIRILRGPGGWGSSVSFSPDGRRLASGSYDGTVAVWDAANGERLATLALDAANNTVAWSPDGRHLAAGDAAGNVYHLEYREP